MFLDGIANTLTNVTFEENHIQATATGEVVQQTSGAYNGTAKAYALGGAIFVDNIWGSQLNLIADGGNVLISGNTANGAPSGIYFGRAFFDIDTSYFYDSDVSSTLNITATNIGDKVLLYDPVTIEAYNTAEDAAFAMNIKSGLGEFVWGGKNVFDAVGGSTLTFENGSATMLAHDFTLTTTPNVMYRTGSANDAYATTGVSTNPLVVNISDAKLGFDVARDPNLAMFDFTNASNINTAGSWSFDSVDLHVNSYAHTSRQLLDTKQKYLIADGIDNGDRDASTSIGIGLDITQNNQLWTDLITYKSPYSDLIAENRNSESASEALNEVVKDINLVSDDEFDLIIKNINAVTPEYALSQADALLRTTWRIADWAAYDGFRREKCRPRTLRKTFPHAETHTWGGYIGDFTNYESYCRLQGYDSEMNGLLAGADRTWGTVSLGLYLAGSRTETDLFAIDSRVKSDGFHFGLLGRKVWTPHFSSTVDLGYAHYETDGYRGLGTQYFAKSDFAGNAFTSGLGLEWNLTGRNRKLCITPHARLRYTHFDQEGFSEVGTSNTRVNLDRLKNDSFQSILGIEIARQYQRFSPSVRVAWRHEYADREFEGIGVYQAMTNMPFVLHSLGRDRDALNFGLDVRTQIASCNFNLGYNLEASHNMILHGAHVKLEKKW